MCAFARRTPSFVRCMSRRAAHAAERRALCGPACARRVLRVQEDLVLVWFGASSVVIAALALAYVCINRAFLDAHTAVDWMTTKCFCLCG